MFSKEFLELTIQEWQPHSQERLTLEDAAEIAENMLGLLKVLHRIDQRIKREAESSQHVA